MRRGSSGCGRRGAEEIVHLLGRVVQRDAEASSSGLAELEKPINETATMAPEVMPLPNRIAKKPSPNSSGKITPFWNPTPIQKDTPATVALRWSRPSWMMMRIPWTKRRAISTPT
jgi:hypothetical protein